MSISTIIVSDISANHVVCGITEISETFSFTKSRLYEYFVLI